MYHARARPRASEYGIGMQRPTNKGTPVHLLAGNDWPSTALCGRTSPVRWTFDSQAVTCQLCIGKMELQPA